MQAIWTQLKTEQPDSGVGDLDVQPTIRVLELMNEADARVSAAVRCVLPAIEEAVELIVGHLKQGGRLIYLGAGTSGRLGILDAAECPPTFNTNPSLVQAVIAGGQGAVFKAVEHVEDQPEAGASALRELDLTDRDVVVGIAASGRTPYVAGGLMYAREIGAATISVCCNVGAVLSQYADVPIEVDTGSEVLMGSTRLKAGTAQKMVLNMLSTVSMVRLGKVYRNLMVDLKATNEKLIERSKRIIMFATGCSYDVAASVLSAAGGHVKTAILMLERKLSRDEAEHLLQAQGGHLRKALNACGHGVLDETGTGD